MGPRASSVILILFSLSAALHLCAAWWDIPHMMTAEIAWRYNANNTAVRDTITSLISSLHLDHSEGLTSDDHASAAVWMDDVKSRGLESWSNWHFIDLPFNPDNLIIPAFDPNAENVKWAINNSYATLTDKDGGSFERAISLRFLLHLVGDMHQPLHCVEGYFNGTLSGGDQGGTLFLISGQKEENLHFYWDSGADLFPDWERPFNSSVQADFMSQVDKLLEEVHDSDFPSDWATIDLDGWANYTHQLAADYGYTNLTYGGPLPDAYKTVAQQLVKRQIVLGGKRLGVMLSNILPCSDHNCSPERVSAHTYTDTRIALWSVVGGASFIIAVLVVIIVQLVVKLKSVDERRQLL